MLFFFRLNAAVNPYLRSSIWGTLCEINCLYAETSDVKVGEKSKGTLHDAY